MRWPTLVLFVCATAAGGAALALLPVDSTWPPQKDPIHPTGNPLPSDPLYLQEIALAFSDPADAAAYGPWFFHAHGGAQQYGGSLAFGDVVGEDDGEFHVVLSMAGEAVLAAEIEVDLATQTGTLEPLWFWLSPYALAKWPSQPGTKPPAQHGDAWVSPNLLLWDFDGDGQNEVAVVSAEKVSGVNKGALFLLQTPTGTPSHPQGYPDPAPVVLDRTPSNVTAAQMAERLSLCRVRATDGPRDIALHDHDGLDLAIWSYDVNPATQLLDLYLSYQAQMFPGSGGSPPKTAGATPNIGTHEHNCMDVDGDGFDEFSKNGIVDFVDASGPTNPTHPKNGVARWVTGHTSGHMDQMLIADWDPVRPGLEILAITEDSFTDPLTSIAHTQKVDVLYDAATGTLLGANEPMNGPGGAPVPNGQYMLGGNFDPDADGLLEALITPKDYNNLITPPWTPDSSAAYTIDGRQEEQCVEGLAFGPKEDWPFFQISVGPMQPGVYQRPYAIDWDGDRASDEIASQAWEWLGVWALRDKALLASGPWPPAVPELSELVNGSGVPIPFQIDGANYTLYYYQGNPSWVWNNGGPGRYTHLYQKLAEVSPDLGLNFPPDQNLDPRNRYLVPWDVCGDQREELVVMNAAGLSLFRNPGPLAGSERVSPHLIDHYRRLRMDSILVPFAFADLPELASLEVRPRDPSLPSRVLGIEKRGPDLELVAIAHFSDRSSADVTERVTWIPDAHTDAWLTLSASGVLSPTGVATSARVHAELALGTTVARSNDLHVLATAIDEPVVLMSGFDDSYLDEGNPERTLRIVARVAQKENGPLLVTIVNPDNSYWQPQGEPVWLADDGEEENGDELAGDGVYSALVDPGPQDGEGITLGSNLRLVRAAHVPNLLFLDGLVFNGGPGFDLGAPGGYVTFGTPTSPVSCGPIPGPWNCTVPPPPAVVSDADAFAGPRIRWCGTRGATPGTTTLFLEAEVLPPDSDPEASIDVEVYLPWQSPNPWTPLVPQGNGTYALSLSAAGAPSGTHILHVRASADLGAGAHASALGPPRSPP